MINFGMGTFKSQPAAMGRTVKVVLRSRCQVQLVTRPRQIFRARVIHGQSAESRLADSLAPISSPHRPTQPLIRPLIRLAPV